jgi:chromosome segregation ATPase
MSMSKTKYDKRDLYYQIGQMDKYIENLHEEHENDIMQIQKEADVLASELDSAETELLHAWEERDAAFALMNKISDMHSELEEGCNRGHAVLSSLQTRHNELREVADFLSGEVDTLNEDQAIFCSTLGIEINSSRAEIVTAIMLLKAAAKSPVAKPVKKKKGNKKRRTKKK